MNELQRVWIVGEDFHREQLYQIRVSNLEVRIARDFEEVKKESLADERLILLTVAGEFDKADSGFKKRVLARRPVSLQAGIDEIEFTVKAVVEDARLQHGLEILQQNARHRSQDSPDPAENFADNIVTGILDVSSCRTIAEVESRLEKIISVVEPVRSVKLAVDPPHVSSKYINLYKIAQPIILDDRLLAHVYVQMTDATAGDERIQAGIADFLLHLSDAIALAVERIRMVREAEFNRELWEASFHAVGDPVLILDDEYNVIEANQAYLELVRKNTDQIVARPIIVPPKDKVAGAEKEWEFSIFDRYFRVSVSTFGPGSTRHVIFMRDITREKKLTEDLLSEAKGQELGILMSSVAHELNNPIGGISALTQLLLLEIEKGSEAYEAVHGIFRSADRCKTIVQTMLSLVRNSDQEPAAFDIFDTFMDAEKLLESELSRYGIEVNHMNGRPALPFKDNRNRFLQVFFYALQHSIQAIAELQPETPQICFRVQQTASERQLIIEDNGAEFQHMYDIDSIVSFTVVKLLLEEINGSLKVDYRNGRNRQIITI